MFWLLFFLIGIAYIEFCRLRRRKLVALSKKFPSDQKSYPVVGHAHMFVGNDEHHMKTFQEMGMTAVRRGGLASYWMGPEIFLVVADAVVNEFLLKHCLEKHKVMNIMNFFVGNGSIYAPVSIWRPRRKLLAPNFNIRKLNRFVDIFAKQSSVMVEQLQPSVGKGNFSVWKFLTTYTFDSVCETTLGVRMNAQSSPDHPFLEAFDNATVLSANRMVKVWLHPDWLYRLLPQFKEASKARQTAFDFVDKIIISKREEMEHKQHEPDYAPKSDSYLGFQSLLEMLLETSLKIKGFTNVELREEMLVMASAGTDTSAVGACFALVMLSRHPRVQEKLVEELEEVLGCTDRPVTAADLPTLKYLDAVVKETLRLYPPVPVIVRAASSDTELQSGIMIPKGTGIQINIWAIHRNPQYWGPDAELFRPERFFEPLKHPAQFVPFSYGTRNCLGYQYAMMSMKTALATIVRHYQILPPSGLDEKTLQEPIRVKYDIMMKAVDKFQIQLKHRKPQTSGTIG